MATEQQQQHAMKSPRPLVYDVDTGTLRLCKTTPRASLSKSRVCSRSSPLNAADQERTSADGGSHKLLGCGVESGESSPTCVIQNSAVRSNSSSPTMSSISKASHDQEGRRSYSASSTATTKSASPESGPAVPHKSPPFKSIQSAAADRTPDAGAHKPKKISNQSSSSSIMHKGPPGIFSFNATYMTRVDGDFDHGDAVTVARRTTFLATPLFKPTPSKWDEAEKWVPGSESLNSTLRAKSRSGPLLAQMVASQAGMLSKPFPSWKPHLHKPHLEDTPLPTATNSLATDFVDEKLSLESDGAASPSCMNGSFMNLGLRSLQSSTRDMGTAMTPLATSVQGTPARDESVVGMTEKQMVEKTRQEIVALGTQLGKASIAAAWAHAARADHDEKDQPGVREPGKTAEDATHVCGEGSRVDAWTKAETAKFMTRFQQEEAKIAAWEEQEKAKAEAEMLRAEAKAELMKAQAHEKRANKVAATVRRGEKLRNDAKTRRTEATAKVTRKAELMRRHGKFTNLLFLSFLCT